MALKTLESSSALNPGADVWLIGDLAHSKWARKIDWYLNFQLTRAEPHQTMALSPELQQVLDKWEIEPPQIEVSERSPLMVASQNLLPNGKTVQISGSSEISRWIKECHRVWQDLGFPTLRVFLPDEVDVSAFERAWPKAEQNSRVEIVSTLGTYLLN